MRKYTEEEIQSIVKDYQSGLTYKQLAEKFNSSEKSIEYKLSNLNIRKRYYFTDDDIQFLKNHYPSGDWNAINQRFPDMKKQKIYSKMSQLGIRYINNNVWTKDELLILKENYTFGNVKNICNLLPNRSYSAIKTKAERIGLKTRDFWADTEKRLLTSVYTEIPLDDVLKMFPNKNRNSIIHQAMRLKITSYDKKLWSEFEDEYIKENWLFESDEVMAKKLKRTARAVQARRLFLDIYRLNKHDNSYESLSKYIRGNIWQWKSGSMDSCNYQCIFTKSKEFEIHHLYGVSSILRDIIIDNSFHIHKDIADYSEEELRDILACFIAEQNKYPLGVCVSKDIHHLFHRLYGNCYNTPEQWYQFAINYNNGIYNDILKLA